MNNIRGLVFDKDGTLFDFTATWSNWARTILREFAAGSEEFAETLGQAVGFEVKTGRFVPDSPVIAGTPAEITDCLLDLLPGFDRAALVARMNAVSAETPQVAAVPLVPLFEHLAGLGLRIGLATNDAEEPARAHLESVGVAKFFHFVSGFDSGFGAKPAPGPLLAFVRSQALTPDEVVMVGDSRHDLMAGRAAGMRTVAVLTGVAGRNELAPFADVVLTDISHLPDWIDRQAMVTT